MQLETNSSEIVQHFRWRIFKKYIKRHALQKFQRRVAHHALEEPPLRLLYRLLRELAVAPSAQRLQHPAHALHITHARLPVLPVHHDRPLQRAGVLLRQLRDRLRRCGLFLTSTTRRRRVRGEEDELRVERFGGEV